MKRICVFLSLLMVLGSGSVSLAGSSGGDFNIARCTVDNGGGVSTGGDFRLTGTIGQHDATIVSPMAGDFIAMGGFWPYLNEAGCFVDLNDWANFVAEWMDVGAGLSADLDNDNDVDIDDMNEMLLYWLNNCPAGWTL